MSEIIKNGLFNNATTKLLQKQNTFVKFSDGHDLMTRLVSIPLGCVGFSITFLEKAFLFVYHAAWSLLELITCHGDKARTDASKSLNYLVEAMTALVGIPLSLLYNPIDLLISAIKTLGDACSSNDSPHFNISIKARG